MFRVEQDHDGKWQLISGGGEIVAAGLSNAEAWRLVDRNTRREDVADWIFRKECRP